MGRPLDLEATRDVAGGQAIVQYDLKRESGGWKKQLRNGVGNVAEGARTESHGMT